MYVLEHYDLMLSKIRNESDDMHLAYEMHFCVTIFLRYSSCSPDLTGGSIDEYHYP